MRVRRRRPIKILRIIDRLNVGGPAIHAVLVCAGMERGGAFQSLLLYGDIEAGEGDMTYLLDHHPVRARRLAGLSRELRPWRDLRAFFELYALLMRERPDVVHTHKTKAGLLGRVAATLAGVPVRVHSYHGHVLSGYFHPARSRAILWLERALGRTSTHLITISGRLQEELVEQQRIAPRAKFRVVPLGLNLEPFRQAERHRGSLRAELGLPAGVPLIGIVGRLVPIKDHETFLRAFQRLSTESPHVHAVLVGGGEREAALRAEAQRLAITPRVHFLGWRRDLPRIYADLDVLALTSRNEGTPVAVIEALAAGVPVVATAVGGVPDVLRGGQRGLLVPAGDEVALGAALQRALTDPRLHRSARDPQRRDEVCAEYGIERLCRDLGRLYEEAVHGTIEDCVFEQSSVRSEVKPGS